MKKFINNLFMFIPFAMVVYLLLIIFWGTFIPQRYRFNLIYARSWGGHTYTRLQEIKNTKDVDILFLGSSHTYRGFDPRLFKAANFTSFNLGSSSQTPIQTELLMKRYLKQVNPELVIFEVFPEIFTSDGVESSVDIIGSSKNDPESFKMALKINNIKTYNTLLYCYIRDLIIPGFSISEPIQTEYDTYISGGYVERKLEYFKPVGYQKNEWKYNQKQFDAFERICTRLKNEKIRFILIYAPVTSSLYKSYTNQKAFDEKMSTYGDYYNFNEILQLDDSLHFYDAGHLNQKGVEVFNKRVAEMVRATDIESVPD